MVVHAAIHHQEHLAARQLAVDHARDVQPRFPDQVAAEFDHQVCIRGIGPKPGRQRLQVRGHRPHLIAVAQDETFGKDQILARLTPEDESDA